MTQRPREVRYELRMREDELRRWRKLAAQTGESFASWWRGLARAEEARDAEMKGGK